MIGILAMVVYIGCYTDSAHTNGLAVVEVNEATGAIAPVVSYAEDNPLYFARIGDVLYANTTDGLASFRIDGAKLTRIDRISLGGRAMCHLAAMPGGKAVTWAAYANGLSGLVEVSDGKFGKVTKREHVGSGPNLPRQDRAHPHCAVPTPDGRGYAVCDLGMDTIVRYPEGTPFATTPAGAGPRHILFHPNGRLAFVVFELENYLAAYEWSDEKGLGRLLDQQRTLPAWPTGRGANGDLAAAVRFSPDMKRVIVSNRGEQSLVAYDFDEATGKLKFKARTVLPGSWPRDFIFLNDTLAIVTMERSSEVHTLRYDAEKGTFSVLGTCSGLFRPVAALK